MPPVIRSIARLNVIVLVLSMIVLIAPASAVPLTFISSTGSDSNPCTAAQPCATVFTALSSLDAGGQVSCLDPTGWAFSGIGIGEPVTIDCAGVYAVTGANFGAFQIGPHAVTIRNLTINGEAGGYPAIKMVGGGSLVLENCVFENIGTGATIDIEPNGPLNLVIKNSRISNGGSGILLKPAASGSINATLDHVTIADTSGGGLRADSSNGPINVDISDSVISNNAANGLNISSGTGVQNAVANIARTTIAKNGLVGIQAGGSNGAALLDATILDGNVSGATAVVSGGRILSYGNNRVIGSTGSGFTGSAALQ